MKVNSLYALLYKVVFIYQIIQIFYCVIITKSIKCTYYEID